MSLGQLTPEPLGVESLVQASCLPSYLLFNIRRRERLLPGKWAFLFKMKQNKNLRTMQDRLIDGAPASLLPKE